MKFVLSLAFVAYVATAVECGLLPDYNPAPAYSAPSTYSAPATYSEVKPVYDVKPAYNVEPVYKVEEVKPVYNVQPIIKEIRTVPVVVKERKHHHHIIVKESGSGSSSDESDSSSHSNEYATYGAEHISVYPAQNAYAKGYGNSYSTGSNDYDTYNSKPSYSSGSPMYGR